MSHTSSLPSQAERDFQTTQRILHDAELLKGGALIVNAQLQATDEQISALHETLAQPTDPYAGLGSLVLHSTAEADVRKPVTAWQVEAENKQALTATLEPVLNPYIGIFDDKLKGLRPQKKWLPWSEEERVLNWQKTLNLRNHVVQQDYSLHYEFDKDGRSLAKALQLTMQTPEKSNPTLHAAVSQGGRLGHVSLQMSNPYASDRELYAGTNLGKFLDALHDIPFESSKNEKWDFKIVEAEDVTLAFHTEEGVEGLDVRLERYKKRLRDNSAGGGDHWGFQPSRNLSYRFNAGTGQFDRIFEQGRIENEQPHLAPEEFSAMLGEVLRFIPTIKVR